MRRVRYRIQIDTPALIEESVQRVNRTGFQKRVVVEKLN
jgi:hypothetical protein